MDAKVGLVTPAEMFLHFGPQPERNITYIVECAGKFLGASHAFYDRIEGEALTSRLGWNESLGLLQEQTGRGCVCHEVFQSENYEPRVFRDLHSTHGKTDSTVAQYGLETYLGQVVVANGHRIGVLGVAYQNDCEPTQEQLHLLVVLANAIGIEEARWDSELALAQLADEYQEEFDAIADAVLVTDRECRITRVNRAALECFGTDLVGRRCSEVVHEVKPLPGCHCRAVLDTGNACSYEAQKSGEGETWYGISVSPLRDGKREIIGTVHTIRDITNTKVAQEAAIRAERLSAVGMLTAGVAHEFNNIHTGLLGFLELILADAEKVPSEMRFAVETAHRSVKRAVGLTRRLFSFARPARVADCEVSNVSVSEAVTDVTELVGAEWKKSGISLRVGEVGGVVRMRPGELSYVLLNLLINARHAVEHEEKKIIEITSQMRSGEVLLEVSDTGCGMSKEQMAKIFTPFYSTKVFRNSDEGTSLRPKGTGLGLVMCQMVVRNAGGKITVKSESGRGTTFTVRLPGTDGTAILYKRQEKFALPSCRVLALDDEDNILCLFEGAFSGTPVEVSVFKDPYMAWESVRDNDYDVAFVDVRMPFVSGEEFVEKMRSVARTTPVLVTGSLDYASDKYPVMYKPFGQDALKGMVEKIMSERQGETK